MTYRLFKETMSLYNFRVCCFETRDVVGWSPVDKWFFLKKPYGSHYSDIISTGTWDHIKSTCAPSNLDDFDHVAIAILSKIVAELV